METIEAIRSRRAVKHFDPKHSIPPEDIEQLLSLAILAPTSFNILNWRMLLVEDNALRQKIRKVSWDQAQVTESSLFIILCADLLSWEKTPQRYWKNAPQEVQDFMIPSIDAYYRGQKLVQRDEAMRSCGIIAQTLMLSARSMGYESCPMDGFDFEAVAELIHLPDDHVIAMFVAIGKGTQEPWPKPGQIPLDEVIIKDSFS